MMDHKQYQKLEVAFGQTLLSDPEALRVVEALMGPGGALLTVGCRLRGKDIRIERELSASFALEAARASGFDRGIKALPALRDFIPLLLDCFERGLIEGVRAKRELHAAINAKAPPLMVRERLWQDSSDSGSFVETRPAALSASPADLVAFESRLAASLPDPGKAVAGDLVWLGRQGPALHVIMGRDAGISRHPEGEGWLLGMDQLAKLSEHPIARLGGSRGAAQVINALACAYDHNARANPAAGLEARASFSMRIDGIGGANQGAPWIIQARLLESQPHWAGFMPWVENVLGLGALARSSGSGHGAAPKTDDLGYWLLDSVAHLLPATQEAFNALLERQALAMQTPADPSRVGPGAKRSL